MSSIARRIATMGASDADVRLWIAAVIANGGSVSKARASIIDRFVAAEKAAGAWTLTDDYWCLWGENATQSLTSLKQRRLATAVNSPTFTADRGYTFDGSTNYLDTGFVPSTHSVVATAFTQRIGLYSRTDVSDSGYGAGAHNTSSRALRIRPRNGSNAALAVGYATTSFSLAVSDARGFIAASKTLANVCEAWKNGVSLGTQVPSSFATSLVDVSLYVGGYNISGVLNAPRACSLGFLCVGASMSAVQELAQYNAIQAFATSVGANV